jgi:hypothetical protein
MPDILRYKVNGDIYNIPEEKVGSFLEKFPDAIEVRRFAVGKDTFNIPLEKMQAFQEKFPDAKPMFKETPLVTHPNEDTIVNAEDQPVPESDAEGFLSDSFKKSVEWIGRSGFMNSVFWKGFMAQGMIQSKMEGGGTAQEGMDLYREESKKQREKLAEHDPTGLEETMAFVMSMTLDAIPFAGYGTMGKGAAIGSLRGLNAAKNFMVSQGLKVGTVNKALPKAAKITGEILKGSSTSAHALAGHTFSSNLLTALEEYDIADILYSEELRASVVEPTKHSFKIGGLLGPVGFSTGVGMQLAQRGIKNNIGRFLATKGIQTTGFGGEVTTFAGVGALLNDEKLTWEGEGGFKETMIMLGALKLSHGGTAAGRKLLGKSFRQSEKFTEKDVGEGIYEMYLTESEGKRLGLGDETTKEYLTRVDKEGGLEKIMEDPAIPMTTKAKLLWSARGVETKELPFPAEVSVKDKDGEYEVTLRDEKGNLIDAQTHVDKGMAMQESLSWQKTIEQNADAGKLDRFSPQQWSSVDKKIREGGIDENGIDGINKSKVMLKHWDDLTPKEKEVRDKMHDIIAETEIKIEAKEGPALPVYKIGERVFETKEEFLTELNKYKDKEDTPEIVVENDEATFKQVDEMFPKQQEAAEKPKEEADRMKEILEELKREDLTKEEKEPLAAELAELYYKEPDRGQRDIISEEQRAEADKRVEEAKKFLPKEEPKPKEDDSKAEERVVRVEPQRKEPGRTVPEQEKGAGEVEAGRISQKEEKLNALYSNKGKFGELETFWNSAEQYTLPEWKQKVRERAEAAGANPDQWEKQAEARWKVSKKVYGPRADKIREQPAEKPKEEEEEWTLEEVQAERAKETKPAAKAERGPAESLLASFRGYTGYWDAPVEKRGKIEESRDEFVKMFEDEQATYEKQIDPRADPKEIDRARRYYAKQIRNVKKLFSRDKAVAQERGDEIRREMMRDFLQEKRKELAQIHGDKVPAMLQAVNKAKTRAEIRNAFDYIQKVLDSKVAKDKLRELNENLDYINKMTRDPSHKLFHDKSSKIARYKDNVAATKETIAKLDRIGEHLYARPNPGSKTNIPMASTVDGIERTARENAIDEIEKLYENNDAPTAEQSDRALELWFTDMGNMTAEEVGEAAIRIKEIVSLGKTKIQEQRDAKRGDIKAKKKELIEDLTGKVKETAPKVIGEGPKKKMTTMIGDLIVGNRNWSSMLDRFSRYEFRRKNEVIGVYDSKLNRQFDKGLTQPAELEVKTLKRTRTEDMVHSFINAFRPTIDSRFKEGGWKERTSLKAIAVRNEVELIDIPFRALTTKEKDPRDRVMKVTRDELSEMYQQMENPETHRSLADGGFLIQRTGEIVKVKRPVVERGEDGVLRKTGEYENTDLGNQVYEAMDAKSELGEKYRNEGLKELAESDFNTYEKWGDEVSPVYEEVFGPPMPRRKKYAPIFRDVQTKEGMTPEEMLDAQSAFAVGNNRHLYKMTRSTKPIVIMGSRRVMSSYMHKMSQFQGKATAVRELNTYWRDKDVQRAIKDEYGQNHIEWLNQFLDQFAGQKVPQKTIRWMDKLRRNIMVASLGIKPMIYVKQTTSLPAYSLFLPRGRLAEGVAEYIGVNIGIIKDRTILNHIKNNDYLKNRYDKFTGGNMDRDISEVQQRAKEIRNPGTIDWNKYRDMSMGLVKMGDRAPIMAGGYAVYKYHYKKNLSKGEAVASKIAADEFMHATKSAQQASDITDLSSYQRGDSWMRMATMYMTAPMSYHRIASGGLRRFEGGIRGGNPKMIKEGARQFFIAHVVLPVIFQAATNFFRFDTEEKRWDILRAALLGNINNLFALGDLIDHVADRFVGKPFDYQTFPAASIPKGFGNTAKEIQDIIEKIVDGDDITIDDILEVVDELEAPMSHAFGVPVPGPKNIYEGIRDVAQGETEGFWDSLARIMGMSENAIEAGREKEEGVRQKQTRQKPQQKEVRQKPN